MTAREALFEGSSLREIAAVARPAPEARAPLNLAETSPGHRDRVRHELCSATYGVSRDATEPAAREPAAREALRDVAAAVVSASSRLRRRDARVAAAVWRELFAGRWSMLDLFEHDGRQCLIVRRSDPAAPPRRRLTPRERQVASHAALGHSNKQIAYDLGLSPGTISTHLAAAIRKLGVGSRATLIRTMAWREEALAAPPRRGAAEIAPRRDDHGETAELPAASGSGEANQWGSARAG